MKMRSSHIISLLGGVKHETDVFLALSLSEVREDIWRDELQSFSTGVAARFAGSHYQLIVK